MTTFSSLECPRAATGIEEVEVKVEKKGVWFECLGIGLILELLHDEGSTRNEAHLPAGNWATAVICQGQD